MRRIWSNMRIHNKLMISFLSVCLVPLILVSSLLYRFSARSLDASAMEFASVFNSQISSSLNQFIKEYDRVTKSALVSSMVIESLRDGGGSILERVDRQIYLRNVMMQMVTLKPEIGEVMLLTWENELYQLSTQSVMIDQAELERQNWFQEMQRAKSVLYVTEAHDSAYYDRMQDKIAVTVSRKIYDYAGKYIGVLMLDIDPSRLIELNDVFLVARSHYNISINVTNVENRILYDSDVSSGLKSWQDVLGTSFSLDKNDSKDYLMMSSETEGGELRVNTIIPRSRLLMSTNRILHVTILATLLCSLLIQIVSWLLSRALTVPIKRLSQGMKQVEKENYKCLLPGEGKDELGMLTRSYNQMVQRIRTLIEDVYLAKIKEKEAKYLALQTQINPHMLYNTLESIRMKALLQGADETADMIKILSKMFRMTLDGSREMSTIGTEIEYAENYIRLQNLRFKNHFLLDCRIEAGLAEHPVIPLLIQPILENSMKHGDKDRSRCLHMSIEVTVDSDEIRILIMDDGCGMPENQVKRLNEKLSFQDIKTVTDEPKAEKDKSIGLLNIAERIYLHYNGRGRIRVDSGEGKGMSVEMGIPWKEEGDVPHTGS